MTVPVNRGALAAMTIALTLASSLSQAGRYDTDRAGATDHPLVSRYAGSTLYLHGAENHATARTLVAGKGGPVQLAVEGKVSNRMYFGPVGRGSLEIFRNYQAALREAGFETLYQCETAQCEKDRVQSTMVRWPRGVHWTGDGGSDPYIIRIFEYKPGFHYIHARKQTPDGTVNVQIALRTGEESDASKGRAQQFMQVIESASVEQGKVTVDASAIGAALRKDGRIALYGILFDTNKAVIKPESKDTLEQMARSLKNDPGMNVFIVGHTDNQGAVEANLGLSRKRAQAVADALSGQYGIAAARLQPHGVANLAPAASNTGDDGRARNRRVEMVVR
ncbi:OmpA family protein [Massilia sp. CCM 8733]|uniref:OmpA family protein n=1 Tax=Massilia mucilaginosa TaxID=2609282 RepID=A0ABX0NMV7_9BURK|nr:OmpA family protein [Massilia mucilaginosa]NHZ88127.1 OmpA family protein [Massilia mucilaginosa]